MFSQFSEELIINSIHCSATVVQKRSFFINTLT